MTAFEFQLIYQVKNHPLGSVENSVKAAKGSKSHHTALEIPEYLWLGIEEATRGYDMKADDIILSGIDAWLSRRGIINGICKEE